MNQFLTRFFKQDVFIEYLHTNEYTDYYVISNIINDTLSFDSTQESVKIDLMELVKKHKQDTLKHTKIH